MSEWARRRPRSSPQRRARRGFGLLEAIVALTLLAGTGMALFAWIQQNLQTASRIRTIEQEAQLQINAQALIDGLDPMLEPSGQMQVSGLTLSWRAEPLEPPRSNQSFTPGIPGAWLVGLYRVEVQARDDRSGVRVRFEQWRAGTRRVVELPTAGS